MPDDLFASLDESRRQRLRLLGWHPVGGTLRGSPLWASPGNTECISEEEAFKRLARQEVVDSDEGEAT